MLLTKGIDFSRVASDREWEPITRLRGQRAQRLREFMEKGADLGLMELRPVWLMNPDVASRVLPLRKGLFDIVIYDEASQMPVEYALPSLYRGQVVIVSGDEKQMPPTAFFSSKVENDEADAFDDEELQEDASDAERETYNETWNRREIKDCPDLLQLAKTVLPSTTLQIHYRSEYRELIGFSNASFYGNRLNVPVRHPDDEIGRVRPIEVVRADGIYENQTNEAEARKVVEILRETWSKSGKVPTIGVVTFNRKQADLIEEILDDEAEGDPWFSGVLARERDRVEGGEDVGFFVKNVENVQGDERDHIIFSSTFGRNTQGTFRRNFGVLGQKGGERRLNVAVTRARSRVIMVTSMPIGSVSDLLTSRRRPSIPRDYLQGYLEYARAMSDGELDNGRVLLNRMMTERSNASVFDDDDSLDGFASSVAEYLGEIGVKANQVSDGTAFGLDFAIAPQDS
jgi:superfamily I DNA and/or RNA helicase